MLSSARIIVLLIIVLLVTACGVRFFYQQLDWLIPWYVRDYITLNDSQRSLLEQRLAATLDWHCQTQLPGYVVWLRELESQLQQDTVPVSSMEILADQAELFWRELMQAVAPDAADILATASEDQIEELFANLATRNAEAREEYVEPSLAAQQKARAERMEQRLRRWFGRLTPVQRERVAQWSADLHPVSAEWLENRIDWQSRLREAMAVRDHRAEFDLRIAKLLVSPDAAWEEAYQARVARNRGLTLVLLADLHALADERQRGRLQRQVANWADSFERAICEAESP